MDKNLKCIVFIILIMFSFNLNVLDINLFSFPTYYVLLRLVLTHDRNSVLSINSEKNCIM